MTKRLAGRKNKLKGRMQPAGLTLAMPALDQFLISYSLLLYFSSLCIILSFYLPFSISFVHLSLTHFSHSVFHLSPVCLSQLLFLSLSILSLFLNSFSLYVYFIYLRLQPILSLFRFFTL